MRGWFAEDDGPPQALAHDCLMRLLHTCEMVARTSGGRSRGMLRKLEGADGLEVFRLEKNPRAC